MKEIIINKNHSFYEIEANDYNDALLWAKKTANAKTKHTIDSWQKRGACKRFTNLFLGDLAKNLFKIWIISKKPHIHKSLIEYDEIRTDDFLHADKFDLKLECNDKVCTIEVKSSGEKYTNDINTFYESRRIIINIESPHSHLDCIYTQILFVPKELNFFKNEDMDCDDYTLFVEQYFKQFKEQNIKAYIVGYANKHMQEMALNRTSFDVENQKANAEARKYADLPIKDSKSPNDFLNALDEFCK